MCLSIHAVNASRSFEIVVPRLVELVVALAVAHGEARVGAAGHLAHRVDDPRRQHDRARQRRQLVDDLLDGDDRALRREHRLLLHADEAPELHVAVAVGPLGVDDGDVGVERRHRGELPRP